MTGAGSSIRLGLALLAGLAGSGAFAQVPMPLGSPDLDGAIAGRVCADQNGDGLCSDDEPGLAGIRLTLETGLTAITDAQGRYHLAAVPARAPDAYEGGRLLPGRHRLRLDSRTLASGMRAVPEAATLEVPMGSLVRQDFALAQPTQAGANLSAVSGGQPSSTRIEKGRVRFLVSGKAAPGDRVTVQGEAAEVDSLGTYRISVSLAAGPNDLDITAVSPSGAVRMFIQRIDVVRRDGGYLIVPRALEPTASMQLPAGPNETASTGAASIRLHSSPGTKVKHPGGEVVVGPNGVAQIPVVLRDGDNPLELHIERPGQPARDDHLAIPAAPRPMAVALLDLEGTYDVKKGGFHFFGRGGAHAQHRIAGFELSGELELRDQDIEDVKNFGPSVLETARRPDRLERALDPEEYPIEWADDSVTVAPNPAEGRLRLSARSDTLGSIGFGTNRAQFADSEVGRYQRELFGPYLDLHTPESPRAQVGVRGFYDPGLGDPTRELGLAPAHEELRATGGSLYYLGSPFVSAGSEVVRVEVRDGLTGLPIRELHYARGRDYEIDYRSGRILLAQPLSFMRGIGPLYAEPLTSNPEPVLVVDYERLLLADDGPGTTVDGRRTVGGEVLGSVGPVHASIGAVQERHDADNVFGMVRGKGSARLGPLTLFADAAQSGGAAIATDGFGVSDDGGLSFSRPTLVRWPDGTPRSGQAVGVRLRGPGLNPGGYVDAAFRQRTPGFSDGSHDDLVRFRQISLRADQPLGSFRLGLLGDERLGADPRDPFGQLTETPLTAESRILSASFGLQRPEYGVSLDARDSQLTASEDLSSAPVTGGRTSVGISGHYRVSDWLTVLAGYKQRVAERGEGLGRFDDTFASAGVDVKVDDNATVGLRGGWGPTLGPQVWGQANVKNGNEVFYGGYSVDVNAPQLGERRTVTGARTEAVNGTAVFVEDIGSHDANALRLSRAVGLSQGVGAGFEVTGRYERGVRMPLDTEPDLARDAAGLTATWVHERVRLFGRGELRLERGMTQLGAPVPVDRTQWVASAGGQVEILSNLRASARFNYSDTVNSGVREARLLEGSAGLAWRFEGFMAVLRYSIDRELPPQLPGRAPFAEKGLQVVSLMPALRLGQRFALAAGGHVGWSDAAGNGGTVLSGTLRPSVKVVGGLELAVEVARRTSAPDGGELTALRGEAGYRINDQMMLAVGYTALGFSGLGLSDVPDSDRVYLRAELAY